MNCDVVTLGHLEVIKLTRACMFAYLKLDVAPHNRLRPILASSFPRLLIIVIKCLEMQCSLTFASLHFSNKEEVRWSGICDRGLLLLFFPLFFQLSCDRRE